MKFFFILQIASLKAEVTSQESKISTYEEELTKAQEELSRLQQETAELEQCVESGKAQLGPLQQHLQDTQQEINSVRHCGNVSTNLYIIRRPPFWGGFLYFAHFSFGSLYKFCFLLTG